MEGVHGIDQGKEWTGESEATRWARSDQQTAAGGHADGTLRPRTSPVTAEDSEGVAAVPSPLGTVPSPGGRVAFEAAMHAVRSDGSSTTQTPVLGQLSSAPTGSSSGSNTGAMAAGPPSSSGIAVVSLAAASTTSTTTSAASTATTSMPAVAVPVTSATGQRQRGSFHLPSSPVTVSGTDLMFTTGTAWAPSLGSGHSPPGPFVGGPAPGGVGGGGYYNMPPLSPQARPLPAPASTFSGPGVLLEEHAQDASTSAAAAAAAAAAATAAATSSTSNAPTNAASATAAVDPHYAETLATNGAVPAGWVLPPTAGHDPTAVPSASASTSGTLVLSHGPAPDLTLAGTPATHSGNGYAMTAHHQPRQAQQYVAYPPQYTVLPNGSSVVAPHPHAQPYMHAYHHTYPPPYHHPFQPPEQPPTHTYSSDPMAGGPGPAAGWAVSAGVGSDGLTPGMRAVQTLGAPNTPPINPGPPFQVTTMPQGPSGANLFVFHIPNDMTNQHLFDLFSSFGRVVSARIMVDRETGLTRGFGFVSYDTAEAAAMAIARLDKFRIGQKRLSVSHKKARGEAGPRRGHQGHHRAAPHAAREQPPPQWSHATSAAAVTAPGGSPAVMGEMMASAPPGHLHSAALPASALPPSAHAHSSHHYPHQQTLGHGPASHVLVPGGPQPYASMRHPTAAAASATGHYAQPVSGAHAHAQGSAQPQYRHHHQQQQQQLHHPPAASAPATTTDVVVADVAARSANGTAPPGMTHSYTPENAMPHAPYHCQHPLAPPASVGGVTGHVPAPAAPASASASEA